MLTMGLNTPYIEEKTANNYTFSKTNANSTFDNSKQKIRSGHLWLAIEL